MPGGVAGTSRDFLGPPMPIVREDAHAHGNEHQDGDEREDVVAQP